MDQSPKIFGLSRTRLVEVSHEHDRVVRYENAVEQLGQSLGSREHKIDNRIGICQIVAPGKAFAHRTPGAGTAAGTELMKRRW
jgi:hypothetical protein